jgi:kynurenine formamidase
VGLLAALGCPAFAIGGDSQGDPRVLDLSLLIAPGYPCTWPTFPRIQITPDERIGPLGPYQSEAMVMDGNTGTQLDVPPHSVTPPDSGLSNAGRFGRAFTETIPAWQFCGEACVIDCRDVRDGPAPGRSSLITKDRVIAWEKVYRPVGPGDVVLFASGYTDAYYRPLPAGRRFVAEPVAGKSPAWPDPDPDCMEYLASRKVMTLGTDSASMGPLPDLAEPTHLAGLQHGMIWTESATGLIGLPPTGAFYAMLSPKHVGSPYAEARALAVVGQPLAGRLIESARGKRVIDLSVALGDDLPVAWTGRGVGEHRQPYIKVRFGMNANTKTPFESHILDSNAGTHLVPPAFAHPAKGFDNASYSAEVRTWLAEYESRYGARGTSEVTAEQVPIAQSCGPARVIDVRSLAGTTAKANWPASPEITRAHIEAYEKQHGPLRPGDIVIFASGWSDRFYRPLPEGKACMDDPLTGKSEGWPAPGPDAVVYLAEKGIRCVGTDAPSLGGAGAKRALMTYWALGTRGMIGVEYLTNLETVPEGAYFLFAALKIAGCHGGPGRALALY